MSIQGIDNIPKLIKELYEIVNKLETNFPGRHFTPDGHLVGSIGEVIVAHYYNLKLLNASFERHDVTTSDGKMVQIKATQVKSIGLRSLPEYLIVIKLFPDGSFQEYYNGPGNIAWENSGKMQKNGARGITLNKLKQLMNYVNEEDMIPSNYNKKLSTV